MPYATPADVREYAGAIPSWIDNDLTDEDFDALLDRWLLTADGYIEAYTGKEWTQSDTPAVVKQSSVMIVANMLNQARLNRRVGQIRTDPTTGGAVESQPPANRVFTQAIKDDLRFFVDDTVAGPSQGTIAVTGMLGRDPGPAGNVIGDWSDLIGQYPAVSSEQQP